MRKLKKQNSSKVTNGASNYTPHGIFGASLPGVFTRPVECFGGLVHEYLSIHKSISIYSEVQIALVKNIEFINLIKFSIHVIHDARSFSFNVMRFSENVKI